MKFLKRLQGLWIERTQKAELYKVATAHLEGVEKLSIRLIDGIWVVHASVRILPNDGIKRSWEKELQQVFLDAPVRLVLTVHQHHGEKKAHSPSAVPPVDPIEAPEKKDNTPFQMGRHPRKMPAGKIALPNIKNIIPITSAKGGVGKSTTCLNIAASLVNLGYRVGVLDADIYGPSLPQMTGIFDKPEVKDGMILPHQRYGLTLMSIGFVSSPQEPVIWRGPLVMGALEQMFQEVAWGELDFLLIDMPPGTGDAHLTLAQRIPVTGAIIVTTPQEIALTDARKGIKMFQKMNIPILGLIENMSYFLCGECDTRHYLFGQEGGIRMANTLSIPFLAQLPLLPAVCEAADTHKPFVFVEPSSIITQVYRDVACQIVNNVESVEQAQKIS